MAIDYSKNPKLNTQRGSQNGIRAFEPDMSPNSSDSNSLLQTSTNIFIYANDSIVGMIQSFQVSENRTIDKLQAIGYEGVVQAVPQNTTGGTLTVSRMALYESNIWNALAVTSNGKAYNDIGGRVHDEYIKNEVNNQGPKISDGSSSTSSNKIFKTLRDQRFPFEIKVKTRATGGSPDQYYVETYIDCWLQQYSKSYTVNQITVAENATISYADVY